MAFTALLIAVIILLREWKDVEAKPATLLIVSGLVGVPIGISLLSRIDERIVKSVLGLTLIAFSAWSIGKPGRFSLRNDRTAPLFGFFAGVLGGAYNTAGPPLVIYASLRQWSPQQFRSTMQAYCLIGSIWVIMMHAAAGNVTRQTLIHLGVAAPMVIAGTLIGQKLTGRLATQGFVKLVFVVLMLMGAGLLASCLF